MSSLLSVGTMTLGQLFQSADRFILPWFQRAYSWRVAEVSRLLGDLIEAVEQGEGGDRFLLGTLMLSRTGGPAGPPSLAIVDGHQRMLTLTIVFAVLRDLDHQDASERVAAFVGARAAGGDRYRLTPQAHVAGFFDRYVQAPAATMADVEEDEALMSASERNIAEVREYVRGRLDRVRASAELCRRLAMFLAERCEVIVHIYRSEADAWRALKIEEETRLAFDPAAQAKATILSCLPPAERAPASAAWECAEHDLGAADLADLMSHIRTLKMRRRSDRPAENDICEHFDLEREGSAFVARWLVPHATHMRLFRHLAAGCGAADGVAPEAASSIARMQWVERRTWLPAGLYWAESRGMTHVETPLFFARLARLVWLLRIAGVDPPLQRSRIIDVVDELDGLRPVAAMQSLTVEKALRTAALTNLDAQNFGAKGHAASVLRLISAVMGVDPGPVHRTTLTVEHILPRNPVAGREWWSAFPTKQAVKENIQRLGNLAFLPPDVNQFVETRDWAEKRPVLAQSPIPLTRHAAEWSAWNRATIGERGRALAKVLLDHWEL